MANEEKQDENFAKALVILENPRSKRKINEQNRGLLIGNITCLL
jgi:hypothetical protein